MLAAIVGIEIAIDRIVGKSKLGQNREARDRVAAADTLARRGHVALSAAMRGAGPRGKREEG
jgi:transcriptional regulator